MLDNGFLLLNRLIFLILGFGIGVAATTHLHKKAYKVYTEEIVKQYNKIIEGYKKQKVED